MRKAQTGEYSPKTRDKRGRFVQSETPGTATTVSGSEPETPPESMRQADAFAASTRIFDRNGKLLFEIYTERNRTPVTVKELPEYISSAHIAIEDKNFYHNHGFASEGLLRATVNTLFRRKLQGGSTITQQLVKTALLSPERTIQRKIREAILTILTELISSKDQILEMYLNHVPYGGTAWGIEAATQTYFAKSA